MASVASWRVASPTPSPSTPSVAQRDKSGELAPKRVSHLAASVAIRCNDSGGSESELKAGAWPGPRTQRRPSPSEAEELLHGEAVPDEVHCRRGSSAGSGVEQSGPRAAAKHPTLTPNVAHDARRENHGESSSPPAHVPKRTGGPDGRFPVVLPEPQCFCGHRLGSRLERMSL